jgi:hypothetical protein
MHASEESLMDLFCGFVARAAANTPKKALEFRYFNCWQWLADMAGTRKPQCSPECVQSKALFRCT